MKSITNHCDKVTDLTLFAEVEAKYSIRIRDDIKEFLTANSGGYPVKDLVKVDGEEYEIRVFLSLDCAKNKNYYIEKAANFFLGQYQGRLCRLVWIPEIITTVSTTKQESILLECQ